MKIENKNLASTLGLLGLIPFLATSIIMWFSRPDLAVSMVTMQLLYAALIISFMGGVQWGYAIKQGDAAKPYQFIISIMPTVIILGILPLSLLLSPHHIALTFAGLLIAQALIDHKTYTEGWFITLRWQLTSLSSACLMMTALHQY